jgi:hypothetical protein
MQNGKIIILFLQLILKDLLVGNILLDLDKIGHFAIEVMHGSNGGRFP